LVAPQTLAVSARAPPYGMASGAAPSMETVIVGPWQDHPENNPIPP
jgi:hypothetical protein